MFLVCFWFFCLVFTLEHVTLRRRKLSSLPSLMFFSYCAVVSFLFSMHTYDFHWTAKVFLLLMMPCQLPIYFCVTTESFLAMQLCAFCRPWQASSWVHVLMRRALSTDKEVSFNKCCVLAWSRKGARLFFLNLCVDLWLAFVSKELTAQSVSQLVLNRHSGVFSSLVPCSF